jgi:hypothetical protein
MPDRNRVSLARACDRCGGEWFRMVHFSPFGLYPFARGRLRWPAPDDDTSAVPILVCLCGRPRRPNLAGVRPPSVEQRTQSMLKALEGAQSRRKLYLKRGSQARETPLSLTS